jgi:hypothetical protein
MPKPPTEDELRRIEAQGLCHPSSLEIFVEWYTFGGISRGLSLQEIADMPSTLRKDFRLILSTISTRRRERENMQMLDMQDKQEQRQKQKGVRLKSRARKRGR